MRDLLSWHLYLGRWAGVQVRLHAFFLFFAIGALALCAGQQREGLLAYGASALIVLLLSVVLHEMGHCFAVRRLGGEPDQVLLWPLGGLVQSGSTHEPQYEFAVAAAGPLVSGALCVVAMPFLLAAGDGNLLVYLHPFSLPGIDAPQVWNMIAAQVLWINFLLVVVNLLPAFPLDGARMLRSILRPSYGYRTSVVKVARVSKLVAVGLVLLAWLVTDPSRPAAWAPLALLAVVIYFSSRDETDRLHYREADDEMFGYDFSQGYTSFDRAFEASLKTNEPGLQTRPGPVRRWLEQRREARRRRQLEQEQEEDRRLDDILARLNETGVDQLTSDERALLKRASARYRNRLRDGSPPV